MMYKKFDTSNNSKIEKYQHIQNLKQMLTRNISYKKWVSLYFQLLFPKISEGIRIYPIVLNVTISNFFIFYWIIKYQV